MNLLYSIYHHVGRLLLTVSVLLSLASCHTVWDDDDCPVDIEYRVKFKYDYNMLFTDAFATQVQSVTLYAFDEQGKLVLQQSEQGEALSRDDYTMKLDLTPGNYRLVAWAGLAEGDAFEVPVMDEGVSVQEDLTCRINRYQRTLHGEEIDSVGYLHSLWHGIADTQLLQSRAEVNTQLVTVPLMKNTNTFRIILQQMAEGQMDASAFEFAITDENGMMTHENRVVEGDGVLTYMPYHQVQGSTVVEGEASEEQLNMVVAELTTGRLMADAGTRLTISNRETGKTVLSIPLIDYLELCKTVANYDMPLQEYLDREDTYNMTFFLDSDNAWINTQIIINDWIVRYNDITPDL